MSTAELKNALSRVIDVDEVVDAVDAMARLFDSSLKTGRAGFANGIEIPNPTIKAVDFKTFVGIVEQLMPAYETLISLVDEGWEDVHQTEDASAVEVMTRKVLAALVGEEFEMDSEARSISGLVNRVLSIGKTGGIYLDSNRDGGMVKIGLFDYVFPQKNLNKVEETFGLDGRLRATEWLINAAENLSAYVTQAESFVRMPDQKTVSIKGLEEHAKYLKGQLAALDQRYMTQLLPTEVIALSGRVEEILYQVEQDLSRTLAEGNFLQQSTDLLVSLTSVTVGPEIIAAARSALISSRLNGVTASAEKAAPKLNPDLKGRGLGGNAPRR